MNGIRFKGGCSGCDTDGLSWWRGRERDQAGGSALRSRSYGYKIPQISLFEMYVYCGMDSTYWAVEQSVLSTFCNSQYKFAKIGLVCLFVSFVWLRVATPGLTTDFCEILYWEIYFPEKFSDKRLFLPLALQPAVGFGLSNNVLPFCPICHQLSPSSHSQHLKISFYSV